MLGKQCSHHYHMCGDYNNSYCQRHMRTLWPKEQTLSSGTDFRGSFEWEC